VEKETILSKFKNFVKVILKLRIPLCGEAGIPALSQGRWDSLSCRCGGSAGPLCTWEKQAFWCCPQSSSLLLSPPQ
jgi:hypothetical protein